MEILLIFLLVLLAALWAGREFWRAKQKSAAPDIKNEIAPVMQELIAGLAAKLDGQVGQITQTQENTRTALGKQLADVLKNVNSDLKESREKTSKSLGDLGERLSLIDKAQAELAQLSGQVVGLQQILDNKQARGSFGEAQLADIVKDGLPEHLYAFQHTLSNNKRVDCLIMLPPPPGPVAIDSKFPLEAFSRWRNAPDSVAQKAALADLGRDVSRHANDIATKYIIGGETADAALMFLPSESVFAEIHTQLPKVIEECRRLRVYPVSPNSMALILNTVRAIMRDVKIREQAGLIQNEVRKLLEDVGRVNERVGNLRTHFNRANDAINKDIYEIETSAGKVISRGEKITSIENESPEINEVADTVKLPE